MGKHSKRASFSPSICLPDSEEERKPSTDSLQPRNQRLHICEANAHFECKRTWAGARWQYQATVTEVHRILSNTQNKPDTSQLLWFIVALGLLRWEGHQLPVCTTQSLGGDPLPGEARRIFRSRPPLSPRRRSEICLRRSTLLTICRLPAGKTCGLRFTGVAGRLAGTLAAESRKNRMVHRFSQLLGARHAAALPE